MAGTWHGALAVEFIQRARRQRVLASVFVPRALSKTERYTVRARAFVLLQKRTDYEKVVDMLLKEFDFLAWHQADELATDAKRVLRKVR